MAEAVYFLTMVALVLLFCLATEMFGERLHSMRKKKNKPFGQYVKRLLKQYFADLNGTEPTELYPQIVEELERHLFKYVISHTDGNISRAAKILGISRATLRKKIDQYDLA